LLLVSGDAEAGEASLREALDYAANQQTKSFQIRTATALAKLLLAQGRRDEARGILTPVYNWFTEGHNTADLVNARTVLSEIG
jgi:predicted ATPase